MSKPRSQSDDRYADVPCQEPDVPHSRPGAWEDAILATSQTICRRWGSYGGMDDWSNDDDRQQRHAAAGNRHRRRMSDTGRMSEWSKSTQANEKLERFCCIQTLCSVIQQKQLEVLGEHRPPPNASIIELLNDFCNAN